MGRKSARRTLVIEKIDNYTRDNMWVYGTSGELIELEQKDPKDLNSGLPELEEGVYFVVNGELKAAMERDPRHRARIAVPGYSGSGRNEERIYSFTNIDGVPIAPITDRTGSRWDNGGTLNLDF